LFNYLLRHPETVSIAIVDLPGLAGIHPPSSEVKTYLATEYGLRSIFVAQQLPQWYLEVTSFGVSPSRGICSVYSKLTNRMITLDLEPDDDDELVVPNAEPGDDHSMQSVDSGGRLRSKSWLDENKFFNADGRAVAREKIKRSSSPSRDSPSDFGPF
jgi:hypothetical protein